ncbi:hypothetical protein LSAT2_007936 [Lamellibrachia satsuma]|nr:hypothetical protein LSAT2_007936 [Lamellibrachia satsuma]
MLQRSDVQMDCAKNGSHLASVKLRGNRNSCRLSGTRMAGLGDRWTGFVVLVMIGVCAQTVSGIDVYPNNDERPETQNQYEAAGQGGSVSDYSFNDGAFASLNQGEYYPPGLSQDQSGSQSGYEGVPQSGRDGQQFDYDGDLPRGGQKSNGDGGYLPPGGQQPDYYNGDASAVAPSGGGSSGNAVQKARESGKMGYGGGLLQYGNKGQGGYGSGLQQYGSKGQGGYGGGLQQYGSSGQSGYGGGYSPQYGSQQSYGYSYGNLYQQQQKPRVIKVVERVPIKEKVYVPVYKKRRKKKKKKKILTKYHGFFIEGGSQLYGKFKSLYECMHYCEKIPTCFAGDYNPWLKKCYIHSNLTACDTMQVNKNIVHFKKVPCIAPETTNGLVTLGAHLLQGVEIKGIKDLQHCIQKCANTGEGIAPDLTELHDNDFPQLCAGIDYDFSNYKCYFLVGTELVKELCPVDMMPPPTPRDLVAKSSVVNILLCPPLPP